VSEARRLLLDAEVERALSSDRVVREALRAAQEDGIVFIDEIDKIVDTSKGAAGATSECLLCMRAAVAVLACVSLCRTCVEGSVRL
jgi:ATP-dependent Clp protease ATP-binding subunit ClpA